MPALRTLETGSLGVYTPRAPSVRQNRRLDGGASTRNGVLREPIFPAPGWPRRESAAVREPAAGVRLGLLRRGAERGLRRRAAVLRRLRRARHARARRGV